MSQGAYVTLVGFVALVGCAEPTSVLLQIELAPGEVVPAALTASVYDARAPWPRRGRCRQ